MKPTEFTPAECAAHQPVMLAEVLRHLCPAQGEVHADGTVGAGGHSAAILSQLGSEGFLLGIDRDPAALQLAEKRLKPIGLPYTLRLGHFSQLRTHFAASRGTSEAALDGFLLDLGVSSMQVDQPQRGFSFQKDGPLDMRMTPDEADSAAELLQRLSTAELATILRRYGEEPAARKIAAAIDRERRQRPICTTGELASLVERVAPPTRGRRIHPATRTFQALRIAVNRELEELEVVLRYLDRLVRPNGRVVILSYHSLEDRIVKRWVTTSERDGLFMSLTDGVERPTAEEIERNPRSRSARLRAVARRSSEST